MEPSGRRLGTDQTSLVRMSPNGKVAVGTFLNSLSFKGDILQTDTDDGINIAALGSSPDGSLMGAGLHGLYELRGKVLRQIFSFKGTANMLAFKDAPVKDGWDWDPSSLLVLVRIVSSSPECMAEFAFWSVRHQVRCPLRCWTIVWVRK